MPSFLHEGLVMLFRERPTLAAELAELLPDVTLPAYDGARVIEGDLTQVAPIELRADLVAVLTQDDKPVRGLIVEAQLRPAPEKKYAWPLYQAAVRAREQCGTMLVVVAPDAKVAEWAARPIATGQPRSDFTPVVIGPGGVPWVTRTEDAAAKPELAVLSALAHGNEQHGLDVVLATLTAASGLDEQRAALYADLVMASLNDAVAKELEAMVQSGNYEFQSEFAKKYLAQGRAEGRAEGRVEGEAAGQARALLRILTTRGFAPTDDQRNQVLACTDVDQLDRWIDCALQAASIDEVFGADT